MSDQKTIEYPKQTAGLHADRLKTNRDNPQEVAFSAQWDKEHEHHDLLVLLLRVPCDRDDPNRVGGGLLGDSTGEFHKYPLGEITERDRIVAATVFQWLGSNCGMDAMRQALKATGYTLSYPKRKAK